MHTDNLSSGFARPSPDYSDVQSSPFVAEFTGMRAPLLLKRNIDALLKIHGYTRKDLAEWCSRTESWIAKIYGDEAREVPMRYVDRIADFFGKSAYELFQPGITRETERRSGRDRRTRTDRRIGPHARQHQSLKAEVNQFHPRRTEAEELAARITNLSPEARALIRDMVASAEPDPRTSAARKKSVPKD